jgi:hypothetical protein
MKHKKIFPIPLPKSSFEGMRSSFFACISLSISSFRITVYLHNDVFPDLGKEEIFLKGQNFSRHPLDFSLIGMRGIFQTAKMPSEPFAFCIKTSAPI